MADSAQVYEFADLRLDVGQQRLTRAGADVPLPRLSFNLLLALLRAAPNVMSIDDLMTAVWPGLVVNPETVVQRIKMLRDAIGDDPRSPRYVGGLRGRGYHIVCPVTEAQRERLPARESGQPASSSAGPAVEARAASDTSIARRRLFTRTMIALGVVLAGAMIAALALYWRPAADRDAGSAIQLAADDSVAVLPFRDLSPDHSAAYVALGVPEIILDRLATIPGLVVIARDSSFDVGAGTITDAAQRLGARLLVTGSVQRIGDSFRMTVRLVEPSTSRQLWSGSFDSQAAKLFAVQERIAGEVATALLETVTGLQSPPAARPLTQNPEAFLSYLQGRAGLSRWTVGDAEAAAVAFERAIAADPGFAAAYAALYDARMMVADRRREKLEKVRDANRHLIERAIELDPADGAAYFVRAIWAPRNDPGREADFRKGRELDPNNGRGLTAYSEFLDANDRTDEALAMLERAMRVDPLSPRAQFRMAMRGLGVRDLATQESLMLRVLERYPNYHPALQRYAKYRWILHAELTDAAQVIEHAINVDPQNPWSRYTAAAIYLDLGDPVAARAIAAGSPQSARGSAVLFALWDRDSRRAAGAALEGATAGNPVQESWGEAEAVRDYALATRDFGTAIDYLTRRYALAGSQGLTISNFRAAACVAHLLRASGDSRRSEQLLDALLPAIDASLPRYGQVYALRTRAMVLMIRGDRDAALATLRKSFEANDYTQWWYTMDRDPLWQPVRADPRFVAIRVAIETRVAGERAVLARLRQAGTVPSHGSRVDRIATAPGA
jgi:TolB-like protein/DNA-binding winged helix-turn-helix (wHTH) protein